MKVWVCTTGSYSDYGIEAIYTTKEMADQWYAVRSIGYSEANEPEEWDTDVSIPGKYVAFHAKWDGKTMTIRSTEVVDFPRDVSCRSFKYGEYHIDGTVTYNDDSTVVEKAIIDKATATVARELGI